MKNIKRICAASLIGVSAIMAASACVSAAPISTIDTNVKMETPNDDWHEVADTETLITLSNEKGVVKVKEYKKDTEVPVPVTEYEKYEEVYQTIYSTANTIYIVTGFAKTHADMKEVREVANSIQLADHQKPEEKQAEAQKKAETQTPAEAAQPAA